MQVSKNVVFNYKYTIIIYLSETKIFIICILLYKYYKLKKTTCIITE